MSQVHGFVDLVVSGSLPGLPWTSGNGGWKGLLELGTWSLGRRTSMWLVREKERDNDRVVLTGGQERRWGRHTLAGVAYRRGGREIGRN
jgi:hypothetical protein